MQYAWSTGPNRSPWILSGTFRADERAKHEFLKDVCAFANAAGGDLIYGIQEANGHADQLVPLSATEHPADATRRRLGQLLEAGIEPRLHGIEMRALSLATGGYVLVVRVPASYQRPHRSRVDGLWRWPVRADTHIVDLTYDQIRDLFDRSMTLHQRARNFRDERLSGVLSGTSGRSLRAGPNCVVHLVPLASVAGRSTVDVRQLHNAYQEFIGRNWDGASRSLNLDGLAVYPSGRVSDLAYTQIFRSGALEAARFAGPLRVEDERDRNVIPSGVVSDFVRDSLETFIAAVGRWNIVGPAIAAAALLDIGNHEFWYQPPRGFTTRTPCDRPNLVLPEVWIEQLSDIRNVDEVARPLLDTLWQSFDHERCMFFDQNGQWARH